MWTSIISMVTEGFKAIGSIWGRGSGEQARVVADTENPAAARSGTAAGAAANLASHNPRKSNEVAK
jgi:hypothetical protein